MRVQGCRSLRYGEPTGWQITKIKIVARKNRQGSQRSKPPYKNGTMHVIFEPFDFIVRLAALVPKPRVNLTRFHGVFAPNSQHRARVTPARRGKGGKGGKAKVSYEPQTPAERPTSSVIALK